MSTSSEIPKTGDAEAVPPSNKNQQEGNTSPSEVEARKTGESTTQGEKPTLTATTSVAVNGDETLAKAEKISEQPKPASTTAWFKRSCKEVIAPIYVKKDFDNDNESLLRRRGLEKQVGADKVPTVFISQEYLWNGTPQILKYWFLEGTDVQKQKVRDAIVEWTWYANVQFNEATSAAESNIRIRFDPDDGSWAYVGRQCERIPSADATMNLAWLDKWSDSLTLNERAVILHEFGHALGLLHEHQSPAHGGTAIINIQAAIDLYTKTQGWSIDQIYHQVIEVYKMSDVSNFSQVDIHSIMHYPQPKELTGLPEDIPYNLKLSDLDKAYMMLQYPPKKMHPKAEKNGWSFEKALSVMGAPDDVKDRVLRLLRSDRDDSTGEICPVNTRTLIEDWRRAVHQNSGDTTSPAASINPAHTIANVEQYGHVTADTQEGDDLCSMDAADDSAGGKPAHAVTDEDVLWPLPAGGSFKALAISYYIRARNEAGTLEDVTADQEALVKEATGVWSAVADVSFLAAKPGDPVDLIIQFNNVATTLPESKPRSSCAMPSGKSKYDRKSDLSRKTGWDSLKADINYSGIFPNTSDAREYKSKTFKSQSGDPIDGAALNLRSVIHELGHWLGLRHEYCGLYGYWMHSSFGKSDDEKFNQNMANKYWSTRYDAGSIMDSIGLRLQNAALEVLKVKGLQPASVTALQDKTMGGVINRVNISLGLSPYDQANIALLYPGSNLVDAGASGTYVLKPSKNTSSQSLVESYLRNLQLYSAANLETIIIPLKAGKWQTARKAYLDLVAKTQKDEAASLLEYQTFMANKLVVTGTDIKGVFDVTLKSDAFPGKPSHGVDNSFGATMTRPGQAIPSGDGSFIFELYKKLGTLYCPGGGQYLALQFPTRFLDKQTYSYKLDGYFSRFNKPVVVNEAEFALSDALYPVAPIVGGPNGQTLSKNYSKALNSLIPTFESVEVRKQREKMRAWLMKETKSGNAAFTVDTRLSIPGIDSATAKQLSDSTGMKITPGPSTGEPLTDQAAAKNMAQQAINAIKNSARGDPRGMTRMEYSDSLMQAYLNDRKTWELQRDDMIKEASEKAATDPQSMEKLTRRLAHITAIEEAKLASKYADAVVRGYSHTVRGFMGHLDIKSTAESLQDAKDSFRESALSSVYAASQVYPVAMQPTDWFEALDTGFTREDLSQDPELIKASIQAKSQLIDALENQIANLRAFNKGDPAVAKKAMEDAAAKRETAMVNLSQKYTASAVSAVKLALEVVAATTPAGAIETAATRGIEELKKKPDSDPTKKSVMDIFGGDSKVLDDIGSQMDAVTSANAAVNSASRALTEHMSEYATAVAGDTRTMVDSLQRQLTNAKAKLVELQESYTIARRAPAATGTLDQVGKLPSGNGGSRWSEIHLSSTVKNDYTSAESTSSSSISSFSCNFWIGSHSSSSSSASASNQTRSMSDTLGVEVAMRTSYVTVDRSGWFDPSLLEMSKSFMRGSDAANYTPWCQWRDGQSVEQAAAAIRENGPEKPTGYLAAFPVGYILVKDCVIKITSSSADASSFKSHFDQQSESSGGFLCFSHSSASRSSNDSNASSSKEASGGIVVRIPGPQILGYIMQLTGKDESQPFKATPPEEMFLEDADTPISGAKTQQPAHAVGPLPTQRSSTGDRQATVRRYDDEPSSDSPGTGRGPGGASVGPTHGVQEAGSSRPAGHLIDALQTALGDGNVAKWLASQPDGTKEELWTKLSEALGKVSKPG